MKNIPRPCKSEVEKYLNRWDSLENYVLQESSLYKLFHKTYPNNDVRWKGYPETPIMYTNIETEDGDMFYNIPVDYTIKVKGEEFFAINFFLTFSALYFSTDLLHR